MHSVTVKSVSCPYCGEQIELIIDESVEKQQYIEDCEVCCRPINIGVSITLAGEVELSIKDENSC